MKNEVLYNYKNVHKIWNGKKWKLEYNILGDGEKSHTVDKVSDDTYALFRFDKDEKLRRFSLWENSYEFNGKHYSYTREDEEFCYDDFVESGRKIWFEWAYPYLTEIFRDENGVRIIKTLWQIVDNESSQN